MKQSPLLEFESSVFAIMPGEDEKTNPGIFGRALAEWLADELRAAGVAVGDVIAEDFGWCVPVESRPHALYVRRTVFGLSACSAPGSYSRGAPRYSRERCSAAG